jgi:hypothetical protein
MIFGKIENGICIDIYEFKTEQEARNFDDSLIQIKEGFGIGDWYKDETWQSPVLSDLEQKVKRKKEIDDSLERIDGKGINRVLEDIINHVAIFSSMYSDTKKIIERKNALREERAKIVEEINSMIESEAEVGAENNTNE